MTVVQAQRVLLMDLFVRASNDMADGFSVVQARAVDLFCASFRRHHGDEYTSL
jgi:hypothetical protein